MGPPLKYFENQESRRSLPRKILKTKKVGEAISGHFVKTILHSVNEQFQRVLLPFIVCSFLNIKFRYAYCLY